MPATWIPAPVTFRVRDERGKDTPANDKTGRRNMAHEWIADNAPPTPACFASRAGWISWIQSAHDAAETDVVAAIRAGRPINYCADCDARHQVRMRTHPGGNRCHPVVLRQPRQEPRTEPREAEDREGQLDLF